MNIIMDNLNHEHGWAHILWLGCEDYRPPTCDAPVLEVTVDIYLPTIGTITDDQVLQVIGPLRKWMMVVNGRQDINFYKDDGKFIIGFCVLAPYHNPETCIDPIKELLIEFLERLKLQALEISLCVDDDTYEEEIYIELYRGPLK